MFTPVAMRQANIFLQSRDVEHAVAALARFERLHLLKHNEAVKEKNGAGAGSWEKSAGKYGKIVKQIEELARSMGLSLSPARDFERSQGKEGFDQLANRLSEAENAYESWRKRRKDAQRRVQNLRSLTHHAAFLAPLDIPLERFRGSDLLHWVLGTMDEKELSTLRFALFESIEPEMLKGPGRKRRLRIFIPREAVEPAARVLSADSSASLEDARCGRYDEGVEWRRMADRYEDLANRTGRLSSLLGIDSSGFSPEKHVSFEDDAGRIEETTSDIEEEVGALQARRKEIEKKISELNERKDGLVRFSTLKVPLEELRETEHLHLAAGLVSPADFKTLDMSLFRIPAVVLPAGEVEDRILVLAVCSAKHAEVLDHALRGVFMEPVTLPEAGRDVPEKEIRSIRKQIGDLEKSRQDLDAERRELRRKWKEKLASVSRLASESLDILRAISRFGCRGDVYMASVRVPASSVEKVLGDLEEATAGMVDGEEVLASTGEPELPLELMLFRIPMTIVPIRIGGGRLLVAAATEKTYAPVLDAAVRGVFLKPVDIPKDFTGPPGRILDSLEARLETAEETLMDLERERHEMASQWSGALSYMWAEANARKEVADAVAALPHRRDTFLVSGWVPEDEAGRLVETVKKATAEKADVELVRPDRTGKRGPRPPTLLRNPRLLKPFEAIVQTFGAPGYGEIDPTPLTAFTFTLMYGMMFGDVGHGALLAAAGLLACFRGRGTTQAMGGVLTGSGLAAVVFGLLYGSVFGFEHLLPGIWMSPLHGIMPLMGASVAGGVALLSAGFLASIANHGINRRWGAFCFGHGGLAGLAFYWILAGGGAAAVFGMISPKLLLVLVPAVGLILLFSEPLKRMVDGRRPLMKETPGIFFAQEGFGLFEVLISDMSNSLSFVRLGAFAVAHAGFMKVVFLLAEKAGTLYWGVFLLGTALVLVFEGLVVGIQALRLQYYEFFGKFFGGRGTAFSPFRLSAARNARRGADAGES